MGAATLSASGSSGSCESRATSAENGPVWYRGDGVAGSGGNISGSGGGSSSEGEVEGPATISVSSDVVGAGFAVYLYNLTRKSRRVVEILRSATDEASRKAAIAQLADVKGNDAMASLARAQLVARDDPKEAMEILERIDIAKAGPQAEDEVRSNLAYMYLLHNRPKDARPLVDKLRLDRQPQAKAKAMYAAVSAETLARTGDAAEAKKLVETYRADDPEYGEIAIMLLRAQVFTFMATKNRGLARRAAIALAEKDPNMLAPFLGKGTSAEMQAMAREVLSEVGYATRQKMKVQRK